MPFLLSACARSRHLERARCDNGARSTSLVQTYKESPCGQDVKHADIVTLVVRPGGERSEDEQDDGRHEQRVGSRPVVSEPAECELSHDSTGKCDVTDVLLGVGVLVKVAVLQCEDRGDGSDDLCPGSMTIPTRWHAKSGCAHVVDVAVGEETGAAGNDGHNGFSERLAGRIVDGDGLLRRGLGLGRLLSSEVEHCRGSFSRVSA